MRLILLVAVLLLPLGTAALAGMEGEKKLFLVRADGSEVEIGRVTFKPGDDASEFDVALDDDKFQVHFLSMRNFRCIDDKDQRLCYLPYPYDIKKRITSDDLTDLEYSLLFVLVRPDDYGINAWNGLYYDLAMEKNGEIRGRLMEADLNTLAVPPEKTNLRPLADVELHEGDPTRHRFPKISIR